MMSWYDHIVANDPNHRSHRDGLREGVMAFALVCVASVILCSVVDVSWVPMFWKTFATILVAASIGLVVGRWIWGINYGNPAFTEEDVRESIRSERARQLERFIQENEK